MPKLPNIIYETVKIRRGVFEFGAKVPQVLNEKFVIFVKYAYNLW